MIALRHVLWVFGAALCCATGPASGELRSVTTSGRSIVAGEMTLDQARIAALNQARTLAVEQAAGVSVSTAALLRDSLLVEQLVNTFSHGLLVEESRVAWKGNWTDSEKLDLGFPLIEVTLTAQVDVRPKEFFRSYALEALLDKTTYRDGEIARLSVSARESLYVVVANYTSTGKMVPLYPYRADQTNLLKAGATLDLGGDAAVPWEVVLRTYAGHEQDTEAFVVLGFPVNDRTGSLSWATIFPSGKELSYAEFFSILVGLPIEWLAHDSALYTVVRR